ncbi:unnamed protein product, partial [marine sediment metagenome]
VNPADTEMKDCWLVYTNARGISTNLEYTASSVLTDNTATWAPDSLIGLQLNPNTNQDITFTIVDNTENTITVTEDITIVANIGDNYIVYFAFGQEIEVKSKCIRC